MRWRGSGRAFPEEGDPGHRLPNPLAIDNTILAQNMVLAVVGRLPGREQLAVNREVLSAGLRLQTCKKKRGEDLLEENVGGKYIYTCMYKDPLKYQVLILVVVVVFLGTSRQMTLNFGYLMAAGTF